MINKFNMLGRYYPFFLDNRFDLRENSYIYQLTSPSYNKKNNLPYFTLLKVGEKTCDYIKDDFLTICKFGLKTLRSNQKINKTFDYTDYINNIILKGSKYNMIMNDDSEFPLIESQQDSDLQKNLIVGLRESVRRNYKLFPGRTVDILLTKDQFVLVDIKEDSEYVFLEPQAIYDNVDINLDSPKTTESIKDYKNLNYKWKKDEFDIPELIRIIRGVELSSFDKKHID